MAENEVQKDLQYQKQDGSRFTRVEMEQQIRETWSKLYTKKIRSSKDFGLDKKPAMDMPAGFLIHWMLDEMIRRGLIDGDLAGVNVNNYTDQNEKQHLSQRVQALVQSGQALSPKQGEGFDMTQFPAPPPPPMPPNGAAPQA